MPEPEHWTLIALKEYIERRFNDQAKAIDAALAAAEKAVTKAEVATEKRFDSVNEFRKTLSDQAASFLQRGEFSAQRESIEKGREALERELAKQGRMQNMMAGALILISFAVPVLVAWFTRGGMH